MNLYMPTDKRNNSSHESLKDTCLKPNGEEKLYNLEIKKSKAEEDSVGGNLILFKKKKK